MNTSRGHLTGPARLDDDHEAAGLTFCGQMGSGLTFCNMNAGALADRKAAAGNDQRHWPKAAGATMKNGRPDPAFPAESFF